MGKTKVTGTYTTESPSQILKKEMEAAGIKVKEVAPYPHQAHHIVPNAENYDAAIRARLILEQYDIDLNSATNGVLLPSEQWSTALDATIHNGRHTKAYCEEVLNRLSGATCKEDVEDILNDIRGALLKGEMTL